MKNSFIQKTTYRCLADLLRINEHPPIPAISNDKFDDWSMEKGDAPILRYLFRNLRPGRHLEFGTWEGAGCLCCLEECKATVWTLNLLEGETRPNGEWAYGTTLPESSSAPAWSEHFEGTQPDGKPVEWIRTDALGMIGHLYREKGYSHRVNQIYCDSRDWDATNYPDGFFDTVLIDGGHQQDVVSSDTLKAMRLVRPRGVIMWHDCCLDSSVIAKSDNVRNVLAALEQNKAIIGEQTHGIHWLNPSFLALAVRK